MMEYVISIQGIVSGYHARQILVIIRAIFRYHTRNICGYHVEIYWL